MQKYLVLLSLLVLAFSVTGCPNSGTNTNPPPTLGSTQQPKTGSTYTYTSITIDANGNPTGSPHTLVDSVVQTGMSYSGKSNVTQVYETDVQGSYTVIYYNYESNGDISINFPNAAPLPPWLTLSVHSSGVTVQTLSDTTVGGVRIVEGDSIINTGTFTYNINGTALAASKLKMVVFVQTTAGKTSSISQPPFYFAFAPLIGYFTELIITGSNGTDQKLVSYKLK